MFRGAVPIQEIVEKLKISTQRVYELEADALHKLRNPKLRKQWEDIVDTINLLNTQTENLIQEMDIEDEELIPHAEYLYQDTISRTIEFGG